MPGDIATDRDPVARLIDGQFVPFARLPNYTSAIPDWSARRFGDWLCIMLFDKLKQFAL